jgi:hypothetical protein
VTGAALLGRLRGVAAFVWDFVVGDDWRLALGVVVGLALTALVADQGVSAWWLAPLFAATLLAVSVWRASGPPH